METKTFKEVFNEIGQKYTNIGIDGLYKDYNILCLLEFIISELEDEYLKKDFTNYIHTRKVIIETEKIQCKP